MQLSTTIGGVFLRELRMDDLDGFYSWQNDPEISQYYAFTRTPRTREAAKKALASIVDGVDSESLHFAIVRRDPGENEEPFIGVVSLKNIHPIDRHAEFATVICATEHMGKGYGRAASLCMIRHGFETLHLRKIYLSILAGNARVIHLYESMGFRYEGAFRKHVCRDGVCSDLLWYSLFPEELR